MLAVFITEAAGEQRHLEFGKTEINIGRVQGNDIILSRRNVSKHHARIVVHDGRPTVVDLDSTNGTWVNGRKITGPTPVDTDDKIHISDFTLRVEPAADLHHPLMKDAHADPTAQEPPQASASEAAAPTAPSTSTGGRSSVARPRSTGGHSSEAAPPTSAGGHPAAAPPTSAGGRPAAAPPTSTGRHPPQAAPPPPPPPPTSADGQYRSNKLPSDEIDTDNSLAVVIEAAPAHMREPNAPTTDDSPPPSPSAAPPITEPPITEPPSALSPIAEPATDAAMPNAAAPIMDTEIPHVSLSAPNAGGAQAGPTSLEDPLAIVMTRLAERFDLHDATAQSMHDESRWNSAQQAISDIISTLNLDAAAVRPQELIKAALHEAVGLGPLDALFSRSDLREVLVCGPDRIFVNFGDGLEPLAGRFSSRNALMSIARRLVSDLGRSLEPNTIIRGRLSFGPVMTLLQEPIVQRGPVIEIRGTSPQSLADLERAGWFDDTVRERLEQALDELENVAIIGEVGAGVSTLLGALARQIPNTQGIVVIESVPDLNLDREHVVSILASEPHLPLASAIQQAAQLRATRLVIDDLQAPDVAVTLERIAARPHGHLLGAHIPHGDPVQVFLNALRLRGASQETAEEQLAAVDLIVQVLRAGRAHTVSGLIEVDNDAPQTRRLL